jgi:hypothetical protein
VAVSPKKSSPPKRQNYSEYKRMPEIYRISSATNLFS